MQLKAIIALACATKALQRPRVIIAPAQFGVPKDYDELSELLRQRGHAVACAPLSRLSWLRIVPSVFTADAARLAQWLRGVAFDGFGAEMLPGGDDEDGGAADTTRGGDEANDGRSRISIAACTDRSCDSRHPGPTHSKSADLDVRNTKIAAKRSAAVAQRWR